MRIGIRFFVLLATFCVITWSQDRLFDKVVVDFPQNVHINNQVVPAGHYELRQIRDAAGGDHIIGVTTGGAAHFETAAIPIPALNNNTPDATRVILQKVGPDYYLDKIWISGKDYGYEFAIPDDIKSRILERAEPLTLSVKFQSSARPDNPPVASAPAARPEPPPVPVASAPPPPQAAPPPQQVASAAPPEPAPNAAAPAPAPEPQTQNTPAPAEPSRLPPTASNWASTLVVGIIAMTAAVLVRRFV